MKGDKILFLLGPLNFAKKEIYCTYFLDRSQKLIRRGKNGYKIKGEMRGNGKLLSRMQNSLQAISLER